MATRDHVEQLKRVKAQYCRFCDSKDWDSFFDLFTDDAVMDLRAAMAVAPVPSGDPFSEAGYQVGKAGIMAWVRETSAAIGETVHHCHTSEIDLISETEASGIWAMEDRLLFKEGGPIKSLHGFGHYHEKYRYDGNRWRIREVRLTRLRIDII